MPVKPPSFSCFQMRLPNLSCNFKILRNSEIIALRLVEFKILAWRAQQVPCHFQPSQALQFEEAKTASSMRLSNFLEGNTVMKYCVQSVLHFKAFESNKTQNKAKQLHHRVLDQPFLYLNFPSRNYGYGTGSRYLLSTINFYGKGIVSKITPCLNECDNVLEVMLVYVGNSRSQR